MNTITPTLPRAIELIEHMKNINRADSFGDFHAANESARELGLKLKRGFYGQRRVIHGETFDLIAAARNDEDLADALAAINYDELML